jgi:hypothetical protein
MINGLAFFWFVSIYNTSDISYRAYKVESYTSSSKILSDYEITYLERGITEKLDDCDILQEARRSGYCSSGASGVLSRVDEVITNVTCLTLNFHDSDSKDIHYQRCYNSDEVLIVQQLWYNGVEVEIDNPYLILYARLLLGTILLLFFGFVSLEIFDSDMKRLLGKND